MPYWRHALQKRAGRGKRVRYMEDTMSVNKPLLTAEEAAKRLSVGRTQMFQLIASGEIESLKIGRLRRIPPEAITDYVRRLRASAAA